MNCGGNMKSNSKAKISSIVIIIVLVLLIIVSAFLLYKFYDDYSSKKQYNNLLSSVAVDTETESTETTSGKKSQKKNTSKNPIDFKELKKINPEIVGWIKIPGTNIDYPVLQSMKSDNYYLHRDIYGNYKYAGSIYMEYCNNDRFTDRVTLLYGHNMINGTMFADLHKFSDYEFFKKHNKFYIYTENKKLVYEIASSYVYDDRHIMNSFNFSEDDVFSDYLDYITSPRSTTKCVRDKLDHKLSLGDKVVTLSTCLNSGRGRYLLQGVLISSEYTR